MIRSYWYLGLVAVAALLATLGPYGAPLAVVGLAFGIFFGTVSIRRGMLSPNSLTSGSQHSAVSAGTPRSPSFPAQDATTPPGA